jgi:outer membrane protein, multidrug efflux system
MRLIPMKVMNNKMTFKNHINMKFRIIKNVALYGSILFLMGSCKNSEIIIRDENKTVPDKFYKNSSEKESIANLSWKTYFKDTNLNALIDSALIHNQELNIVLQEIQISKNEIKARKGEYLPFVNVYGGGMSEKTARYTRYGALENQLQIKPGTNFPEFFGDYSFGLSSSWELDIWKKLRNSKKAAVARYLASMEGKNFMVTNIVAEISEAYYELLALDNLLEIIEKNSEIQSSALATVKQQKESAKVSQLAVNRFEAQLLHTQNLKFEIKQKIVETENRINFLAGRYPQSVKRSTSAFLSDKIDSINAGLPSQLLMNRPDIREAEMKLAAAKLDVKVARARFYPSVSLRAGLGFQAFNPAFLVNPESILFNMAGDLMAPLINRNAIKAAYNSARYNQIEAIYEYERSILNGYTDVLNQLSKLDNYSKSYEMKSKEVDILMQSVSIAGNLFNSARADYAEVLLTQREALDSKMEMVDSKLNYFKAKVQIYRALGGGWR